MKYRMPTVVGSFTLALLTFACSSGRDVEVTGQVSSPASLAVQGKLLVEFLDITGEGDAIEKSVAHSLELDAPGDFKATVSLEGDKVMVRAINDRDGDGKCSAGEAWGESETAEITAEDKAPPLTLTLGTAACPAE